MFQVIQSLPCISCENHIFGGFFGQFLKSCVLFMHRRSREKSFSLETSSRVQGANTAFSKCRFISRNSASWIDVMNFIYQSIVICITLKITNTAQNSSKQSSLYSLFLKS